MFCTNLVQFMKGKSFFYIRVDENIFTDRYVCWDLKSHVYCFPNSLMNLLHVDIGIDKVS